MPEGDTIFRTASALRRAIAGTVVAAFSTDLAVLAAVNDRSPVAGRTISRCTSAGKHVLIAFSGELTLRTHMRMSGSWHLYRPGEGWQRARSRARIRIDTPEWVAVAFDVYDAEFLTDAALAVHHTLARLGPDLLSPQFDRADVLRRLAARGRQPIAEALLDQRLTAGIGNVFKSEILFLCGIAPSRPVDSLGDADREALIDTARRALSINVVGGTMRRTTGRDRPGERLWVYGRAGRPCRRCGTLIRSAKTGLDARSTYWCPACQPA